jgi:cell division septum initiation protein DivIVA
MAKIEDKEAIEAKITALQQQLKQAKIAKQKIAVAQKKAEAAKKKTEEDRKKILIGAMMLNMMSSDTSPEKGIQKLVITGLNSFLIRPDERELFGLPQLKTAEDKKS